MKKHLLLGLCALFAAHIAQGQGISFFEGTWEEAKAKAKAENKIIFVDSYAAWCGPCKWMAANSFPDAAVGEHFNKHFINFKIDMEKGEGPAFAKTYPVRAYPTLMFIKGDGALVHQVVGAQDASALLAVGKEVQTKFGNTGGGGNTNTGGGGGEQPTSPGIAFFQGNWEEAKAKAKAENKLIFVDAYAAWCGPCKWMAANSFPDAAVGEHFNKHFVNFKIDMEKGEGPAFARTYPVSAYPTLMFIRADGSMAHQVLGAQDAAKLLALGKEVQSKFGNTSGGGGNNPNPNPSAVTRTYSYKEGGSFVTQDLNTWTEKGRDATFYFKLQGQDDTYFYLLDASRGVEVAIPKNGGQSYVMRNNKWSDLYVLTLTTAGSAGGGNTKPSAKFAFTHTGGSFSSNDGKTWKETLEGNKTASYTLIQEDELYFYLQENTKGTQITLPKAGGQSYIWNGSDWKPLYQLMKG